MRRCAHSECRAGRLLALVRRGLRFDGEWFCTPACLADATTRRLASLKPPACPLVSPMPPVRLGASLVASRAISGETLHAALEAQRVTGQRLGAQLLAMRAIDETPLTRALARQCGVGFLARVDIESVRRPVAGLSRTVVHALGVVPLCIERDGTLRTAVTAPLPRMAIAALQSGTGRRVRPYLVSDAVLASLLDAYGEGDVLRAPAGVGRLSAAQAARRIVDAAIDGTAASWQHTWGPGFAWIRLDGAAGREDLIVAP